MSLAADVERLLRYGQAHGLLKEEDRIPARNALLDLFRLEEPLEGEAYDTIQAEPVPAMVTEIMDRLLDEAYRSGIMPDNTLTCRDLWDARIMGLLMPRQSEVARQFWNTAKRSIRQATDEFYALSQASNYIRMDRISKNEYWVCDTPYGQLQITINLSKPEKDPKEIADERNAPKRNYPKCLLCVENVGYAGRLNHPARQNHRVVPVNIAGEHWYLQYSPYVYYNEHSIIFSAEHRPMQIEPATFTRLLDFASQFPHYFVGSNADLPIVGGSILNHDHFQGGRHAFPMQRAEAERLYAHSSYPGVTAALVKWPLSVIRLSGKDRNALASLAAELLAHWRSYEDGDAEIIAFTETDGRKIPHNTITPIARVNEDGEYEMDLVLRNNRTSEEHPHGIFHPHQELHHIKKENIGLIEVMGLAVLPGRLQAELREIRALLTGQRHYDANEIKRDEALAKHGSWIEELVRRSGTGLTEAQAMRVLQEAVGDKFLQVLEHAGVFKQTASGRSAFDRCMANAGLQRTK
ncbi:UDP-glucose--hexose-1-phosphate uridylyltransferase [Xylanibacillus composti]|uniref:Galactose-1-phosphate uridylyltransferase n=1 Tax=Xylanibacillus composti TaxID=1572762 RepID=A0A8J4H253_9BACL|nr:UDP-glucose--hexose-1-phosphate uridylyltransferase [Xylanibacillus composti]MDT9724966.1 UDP-glucose--hexose-1-phosphate uridylyltransferase [Xylanibacillus composti]GIQ68206.1 galactose-1-phosphate uridylyltransferase [Xylanibacillus composti]